jgi:hypothetical protein
MDEHNPSKGEEIDVQVGNAIDIKPKTIEEGTNTLVSKSHPIKQYLY